MFGIKFLHSFFYRDVVETPEASRFRRYLEFWTWILYNDSAQIHELERQCGNIIREKGGDEGRRLSLTDIKCADVEIEHPFLANHLEILKKSVRRYSKDALLAHAMAQLPDQSTIFAERLARAKGLFENGIFLPTGEREEFYKAVPPHSDTWSLKRWERQDIITNWVVRNIDTIDKVRRWVVRKLWCKGDESEEEQHKTAIELSTITRAMALMNSIYAPLFLTGAMAALFSVSSIHIRIALSGLFGLLLALSLLLIVPNLKRGEQFAIMAGFYAVAGIFVGVSGDPRCSRY